ncbi:MAG: hypothetical protein AB1659_10600, partial [Thermodesulfobacteriota bacterium]
MNHLTRTRIPVGIGLSKPLRTSSDKGLFESKKYQSGVRLIIDVLRNSNQPISIIATGSLRDIAAAFNQEPDLFKNKV